MIFYFEIMFTYFNGYLFSKMCIHFNFGNERKRTKTGSGTGTKTNGNRRIGAQQIIGNFDDSRRMNVTVKKTKVEISETKWTI
jgi:hypothetical protein